MKKGDYIFYIGKSNIFFTKYKKYKITEIEYYLSGDNSGVKQKYVFFINDLDSLEWVRISQFKKIGFVKEKEFRKIKLKKLNNRFYLKFKFFNSF